MYKKKINIQHVPEKHHIVNVHDKVLLNRYLRAKVKYEQSKAELETIKAELRGLAYAAKSQVQRDENRNITGIYLCNQISVIIANRFKEIAEAPPKQIKQWFNKKTKTKVKEPVNVVRFLKQYKAPTSWYEEKQLWVPMKGSPILGADDPFLEQYRYEPQIGTVIRDE